MKDSGNPPPPPDPTLTANAQSGANIQTAIANARLNRVNQSTPWGSISYTQGPNDANGVPSYSSQIQLSPMQQQLLEQQQQQSMMRAQIAQQILGNSGGSMGQPLDLADLPGVYSPTGGGHGTTWMGNPHSAPVGMAVPQIPPPAAPAAPAGAPAATSGPNPLAANTQGASPQAAALAQLLMRGNNAPNSSVASTAAPSGGDPYGKYGNLFSYVSPAGSGQWATPTPGWTPQNSGLPDYIAKQFYQGQVHTGGDGDQQSTQWQLQGGGGGGGVTDRNGNNVIQVGDPSGWGKGDSVIDRSKVHYDPDLGYVTDRSNIHDTYVPDSNPWLHLAEIWAGGLAAGAGAGALGLSGEAAGTGAAVTGGMGAGEAGAAGAGVFGSGAGAAGAGAGLGAAPGAFDAGGSSGFGGSTALNGGSTALSGGEMPGYANEIGAATQGAQAGAPVTDLSVQATQPSVWSQMLQNLQNGRGLLGMSPAQRTGLSLAAQMLMRKPQGSGGGK